jgi:hypothetical protein
MPQGGIIFLGCLQLEEELDDPFSLGADDAVEEHDTRDCYRHISGFSIPPGR